MNALTLRRAKTGRILTKRVTQGGPNQPVRVLTEEVVRTAGRLQTVYRPEFNHDVHAKVAYRILTAVGKLMSTGIPRAQSDKRKN